MGMPERSAYYGRVLSHAWESVVIHARATVITCVGVVVGVVLLAVWQINPSSQTLLRTIAGIAWPLLLLLGYFLFYVVIAPWKLHEKDARRIKELEERPADALFHPYDDMRGRRIQSVVWGSAQANCRVNVAELIKSRFDNGDTKIPVNNGELLVPRQEDPDPGNEHKFLTITFTETRKQGEFLELPFSWLGVGALKCNIPTQIVVEFNDLTPPQRLVLWRIFRSPQIGKYSLQRRLESIGFASPVELIETVCGKKNLVVGDDTLSIRVDAVSYVERLFLIEPPSSGLLELR